MLNIAKNKFFITLYDNDFVTETRMQFSRVVFLVDHENEIHFVRYDSIFFIIYNLNLSKFRKI